MTSTRHKETVSMILKHARAENRQNLTISECDAICRAYGIPTPKEQVATSAKEAVAAARAIGYPVALKIVSPDIVHKSDAGGVRLGLGDEAAVRKAFDDITASAQRYAPRAGIQGVLVQAMVQDGREVIIGINTDPTFDKVLMFGLGGIFVETLRDVTFGLAPVSAARAKEMFAEIKGYPLLTGARGEPPVNLEALASLVMKTSQLVSDFPEIAELDLNPVFASPRGVIVADARITLGMVGNGQRERPSGDEILAAMQCVFKPRSIAVIGASAEVGKIGYAVVRNLLDGKYEGTIYPINPRASEIQGLKAYPSIKEVPDNVDVAVFAIPARLVAGVLAECGEKGVKGAILIPSGFAEVGEKALQDEAVSVARRYGIRIMGPNIYGYYYTHENLCATFCTPYTEKGPVALSSQSGGVGMAIIGFSRSHAMGVSAIVGLGNKSDIDEDDLLEFFGQDDNTQIIAMHVEDLKDGRAFVETASRVSKQKPVIVLKAGRTAPGARAAVSHTGALAGMDQIYEAAFKESGVLRARTLEDLLGWARALAMLPTPKGENVLIVTGAGGSGVLLADACVDHGLKLMALPSDLEAQFKELIPPFGASGNPVDITGGEPPETYRKAIRLAMSDPRVHALILGYWHTIITPPMVFARLVGEVLEEARAAGQDKPVVASLVGDVEVEEACRYLEARGVPAYPYAAERPVAALGAKYRWAHYAGKIPT